MSATTDVAGFSLRPTSRWWTSPDGLVGYVPVEGEWEIQCVTSSCQERLRGAGVGRGTRFPTRRDAVETAVAILGCDPRVTRGRFGSSYWIEDDLESGAAAGFMWGLHREGRGWRLRRSYYGFTFIAPAATGIEARLFPTRRAALVALREEMVEAAAARERTAVRRSRLEASRRRRNHVFKSPVLPGGVVRGGRRGGGRR